MQPDLPKTTIVIPCRNEEKFIAKCLDGLLAQNYPKNKIEILVVDGMSSDRTKDIVASYFKEYSFIKLLENKKKVTPAAMNIGIIRARGEYIFIMGAHAEYDPDYVAKCVSISQKYNADNVGGTMKVVARNNSSISKAIALVISSFFGAGNASYKTRTLEKIIKVDTVFGGCYRKAVFKKIGLFDERLIRNQDLELNLRLKNSGGQIILAPDIISYYYPKADLASFAKHNFADGYSVVYPLKYGLKTFTWRHLLPLVFVVGILFFLLLGLFWPRFFLVLSVSLGLYAIINIYFSAKIAFKEKNAAIFFAAFAAFFIRHFFYGLGSVWAAAKVMIKR